MIAPVAMAITPEQSNNELEIYFQVWRPDDLIPAELDENKIQLTDDGDVILIDPDNMQVEEKPFTQISEEWSLYRLKKIWSWVEHVILF